MATGKISRLPREIREQVNERLDAGEPGKRLVAWLNELPAVRALLAAEFGGAAINEQNLTNWKQGGFREWRMEREVNAFTQQSAGAAVVTPEQLSTIVAVRYLAVVREWQQSPVPAERRWRQMRVILQDVLKLQRQGQLEQRLELELEKLEFAKERFEAGQQTDVRRVMTAFLVAARQWPEVQEALATAFRMLQERKEAEKEGNEAELGPIKVNQGENFPERGSVTRRSFRMAGSFRIGWQRLAHLVVPAGHRPALRGAVPECARSRTGSLRTKCHFSRTRTRTRRRTMPIYRAGLFGGKFHGNRLSCGDGSITIRALI